MRAAINEFLSYFKSTPHEHSGAQAASLDEAQLESQQVELLEPTVDLEQVCIDASDYVDGYQQIISKLHKPFNFIWDRSGELTKADKLQRINHLAPSNFYLTNVSLSGCGLTPDDTSELTSLLTWHPVTKLDISNNRIGKAGFEDVIKGVEARSLTCPIEVNLSNSWVVINSEDTFHRYINRLEQCPAEKVTVNLAGNYIRDEFVMLGQNRSTKTILEFGGSENINYAPVLGKRFISKSEWGLHYIVTPRSEKSDFGHAYVAIEGIRETGQRHVCYAHITERPAQGNNDKKWEIKLFDTTVSKDDLKKVSNSAKKLKAHDRGQLNWMGLGLRDVESYILVNLSKNKIGFKSLKTFINASMIISADKANAILQDIKNEKASGLSKQYKKIAVYEKDVPYSKRDTVNCCTWALYKMASCLPESFCGSKSFVSRMLSLSGLWKPLSSNYYVLPETAVADLQKCIDATDSSSPKVDL